MKRGMAIIGTILAISGGIAAASTVPLNSRTAAAAVRAREARVIRISQQNIRARCWPHDGHQRCAVAACFKMFVQLGPVWVRFDDDVYPGPRVVSTNNGIRVNGYCAVKINRSLSWFGHWRSEAS